MRKLKNEELGRPCLEEFKTKEKTPIVLILDNVRSLNNIGSIFRTADAFAIEKIILCGGDANLLGLTDYLSASLKIPVERADIWTNIDYRDGFIPEIEFNDSLRYATAVGLALGGFWGHD